MNDLYSRMTDIEIVYPGTKTCPIWLGNEFWGNAWSEKRQVLIIGERRDCLCNDLLNYCVVSYTKWDPDNKRRTIGYWTPASVIRKDTVVTLEALLCHENPRLRTYAAFLVQENEKPKKKRLRCAFDDLPI